MQNSCGGPYLLHILAGDGIFVAIMILAMAEFSVTDGAECDIVVSLTGGFLNFERYNILTFCFN